MAGFDDFRLYHYDPSTAAAILFIILFTLSTSLHIHQCIATRTYLLIPLTIGGLFEILGYTGRAIGSTQSPNWTLGPYIMQSLLLLLAPLCFAATIYMQLGRIVEAVGGQTRCMISLRWLTRVFVAGDVMAFFVQGGGGGIMSRGSNYRLGSNIIIAGLILQLVFFGFFVVVAVAFDCRIRGSPTALSRDALVPWYKHLVMLYVASALIMVRNLVRLVEYVQGNDGYVLGHEVFLYIFDALLMLGVVVIFNVNHPSEIKAMLRGGKMVQNVFQAREK